MRPRFPCYASCLCQRELFTVEFRETLHGLGGRVPRRTESIKFRIERGPALEQRGARVGLRGGLAHGDDFRGCDFHLMTPAQCLH